MAIAGPTGSDSNVEEEVKASTGSKPDAKVAVRSPSARSVSRSLRYGSSIDRMRSRLPLLRDENPHMVLRELGRVLGREEGR